MEEGGEAPTQLWACRQQSMVADILVAVAVTTAADVAALRTAISCC